MTALPPLRRRSESHLAPGANGYQLAGVFKIVQIVGGSLAICIEIGREAVPKVRKRYPPYVKKFSLKTRKGHLAIGCERWTSEATTSNNLKRPQFDDGMS